MSDEFDREDLDDKKDEVVDLELDAEIAEDDGSLITEDGEDDATYSLYDEGVEDGEYSY